MKIGIIGGGFVGTATSNLVDKEDLLIYDIEPNKCVPNGLTLNDLIRQTELIFICVPTPMNKDGSCCIKIVENVVEDLKNAGCNFDEKYVIIRSTVPPGTSRRLNCYFMPEFLTEVNYLNDFYNTNIWLIGAKKKENNSDSDFLENHNKFIGIIVHLLIKAKMYNRIKNCEHIIVSQEEAEMIKYFRNCFLATKVAFCNEIYKFCNHRNIDYNIISQYVKLDERIGNSHLNVPGYDGHFGFGGTCFPKDINALAFEMKKENIDCPLITSVIYRNENIDRPEKDWLLDKGRTNI